MKKREIIRWKLELGCFLKKTIRAWSSYRYSCCLSLRGWGRCCTEIVRQRVASEIAIPSENFATRDAMIWLYVSVRQEMSFQITSLIKASRANWTLVGRFLHVKYFVNCQSSTLAKTFAAFSTFEWFLFAVDVPETNDIFSIIFQFVNYSRIVKMNIFYFIS